MTIPTAPPSEVIIGLDVGTTGTKVVAFGLGTPWRHVEIREYPLLEPSPGQQVQDPTVVLDAAFDALRAVTEVCRGARVHALAVSTAMHALIGLDGNLRPVTDLLTWADARAEGEARRLHQAGLAGDLHRRTGTPVHPMSPMVKLHWFARHEPELASTVRWWLGLKDLVLLALTGEVVTERSSASGTGLSALATGAWDESALELAGVDVGRLPPISATTDSLPLTATAAGRAGLAAGTPVVLGAADGPLGNVGVGAIRPGQVGLSLGTSGAARMMVGTPPADLDPSLFCYALTEDAFVVGGAISNGAIVVRWAGDALAPEIRDAPRRRRDAVLLELAATAPAGSDGLVMLPYLLAERAPLWDPGLPGAYLGLRRSHGRPHLLRAAVEGVCLQLSTLVDRLADLTDVDEVRVTGGAFRSQLWRQVLAGALGRPITMAGQADGSALGAVALGLLGLGLAPDLDAAIKLLAPPEEAEERTTFPDPALVATYDETRRRIPALLAELDAVGRLFATSRPAVRPSTARPAPASEENAP